MTDPTIAPAVTNQGQARVYVDRNRNDVTRIYDRQLVPAVSAAAVARPVQGPACRGRSLPRPPQS